MESVRNWGGLKYLTVRALPNTKESQEELQATILMDLPHRKQMLPLFEPVELESIALGRSTDYIAGLMRTGSIQSHQVSVSGGNQKD